MAEHDPESGEGEVTCTREAMMSALGRLSREVIPLFIVMYAGAGLIHTLFGAQRPWMLAVFNHRRGSHVPWSSCTARPFKTLCIFALNAAAYLVVGLPSSSSASSLVLATDIPGWMCGLGAALAVLLTGWPLRRQCHGYDAIGRQSNATVATPIERPDCTQQPACCIRADRIAA
jgi:hypothetical protein